MNGISQNLRRAIVTHSKHAHDDITAALIEHARATLIHERSVKRELEAVRADVRAIGQPIKSAPTPAPAAVAHHPTIPNAAPSVPVIPAGVPGHPADRSYLPGPSPAASSLARPSIPAPSPVPVAAAGASHIVNGGRPLDGTQSMIVPPLSRGSNVNSPTTFTRSMTSTPTPISPTSFDPLSQSVVVGPSSANANGTYQPTHAATMGRSFMAPQRSRIDDREAARKLANFL